MIENLFMVFFIEIAADFITGIIAAGYEGKLKSSKMRRGLWTTMGEVTALALMMSICNLVPESLSVAKLVLSAMIFKEGISICENLGRAGMWIPSWIKKALECFSEDTDSLPSNIKDKLK